MSELNNVPNRNQLITIGDLADFKVDLMTEIKALLKEQCTPVRKQWLRSAEVRKMLGISAASLQNLRVNGILNYTRMGTILLYSYEDIMRVLEANRRVD